MKTIKYLFAAMLTSLLGACENDDKTSIACSDIINLTAHSGEGQIQLEWDYPEGENTIRYIEICYWDPGKIRKSDAQPVLTPTHFLLKILAKSTVNILSICNRSVRILLQAMSMKSKRPH